MIAGSLELQMSANLARLAKDMHEAKSVVGGAMSSIQSSVALAKSALGALGIGLGLHSFIGMINGSIESAEKLHDLSLATRMSVEDLSGLRLAAKQSGSDLDSIAQAINKLGQNIGKNPEKFRELGITAKDNFGAMKQLADITNLLTDEQQRNAVLAGAMGKSWQGAAPFLSEGSKKMQELVDKGKLLSGITSENAKQADEFKDKLSEASAKMEGTRIKAVLPLLPRMIELLDLITEATDRSGLLAGAFFALGGATELLVGQLRKLFGLPMTELDALERDAGNIKNLLANLSTSVNPAVRARYEEQLGVVNARLSLLKHEEKLKAEAGKQKQVDAAAEQEKKKKEAEAAARAAKFLQDGKAGAAAYAAYLESKTKTELETLKDGLTHRQQMLDSAHQENLIGDRDYYEQRIRLAYEAATAEDAALAKLLGSQQKELGSATKGTAEYWKAMKDVSETEASRVKVMREFGQTSELAIAQARKAMDEYKRSIESVNIQILQLTGETSKAAAAQIELQNRDLRKKALANDDPTGVAAIDRLAHLTVKQAEFNEERDKLNDVNARLHIEEERIQNTLRTGSITELESLMKTGNARAESIKQQEQIVANLKRIAAESSNPALVLQAEQAQAALEKLRSETNLFGQKIESVFSSAAANAFSEWANGSKNAKEAFMSFVGSVLDGFARMAAEAGAQKIFKALGVGDLIGSLVSPLTNAIGTMITTWAGGEAAITAVSTAADAERMALGTAATIEGIASAKIAAMSEITAYAGIAAAAAMASVAAIPFYGWAMAPGVGAETFATAMSYLALAALETGTNYVPQTGMYMLHQGEAVQPKKYNPAAGGGGGDSGGGGTHLHFHGPVFNHREFGKYLVSTLKGESRMLNPATANTGGG